MKLASEILILAMMIVSNGRVFIVRKANVDSLVMLSPLAFVLSILHFFAFGVDLFSVILPVLSLIVVLSNFHAFFRFSSRLIVDRYSPAMKTWAVITIFLSTILLIGAIYFRPVELHDKSLNITETRTALSGNFMGGFRDAENFAIADAHLFEFTPNETAANENGLIVVFVPDKRGDTQHYKLMLQLLANKGYICCSCDFFAKDGKWVHTFEDARITRRIGLVIRSLTNNRKYMSQKEFYTYNFSREFTAMINILDKKYGKDCKYLFVTDNMGFDAASDVQKKFPEKVTDIFDISTVDEYKTSGYGFIEQTDPLLALIMKKRINRDTDTVEAVVNKITDLLPEPQADETADVIGEETEEQSEVKDDAE